MSKPYALLRAGFPYLKTIGYGQNLRMPLDIAFGKEGRLYALCHHNNEKEVAGPIVLLNFEDDEMPRFGRAEHSYCYTFPVPDGQLMSPVQIIADSDENLYVSDEGCDRISIWDRSGEFVGRWGDSGNEDGKFDSPSGIAFDSQENLYVVDTRNHRIQKFTKDGQFLTNWGVFGNGDGEFNMPWGIAVDTADDVYIADWRNDRIQRFTARGEFVSSFGDSGQLDGQLSRPAGVAVDKDGDIYVCDWGNSRVQLFASDGRFVQKFLGDATMSRSRLRRMNTATARALRLRESGNLEIEKLFDEPWSVRVDDQGHMFVADHGRSRFQIYRKEAYPLGPDQIMPPLRAETLATNM